MTGETETSRALRDAAQRLAKSMAGSECYKEFERAQEAFHANSGAQRIFEEFLAADRKARLAGSWGGLSEVERKRVEALRTTMSGNETLRRSFQAQESCIILFKEVNELMKAQLGFDFADMARPATGCCG